ncbi:MAG: uncharacterized protein K0R38_6811 [Polyangiaceae bacterium]|jgi:hypothetical protein|nr:uncharacterized protein [Polyangiaceae bacterium]
MGKNRVFFPQEALDGWLLDGKVEIAGSELTIPTERRRYRLVEAVRVLSEEASHSDPDELVGKVKTVPFLVELGAELLGDSMVLGDNAYRVVAGWLGTPVGSLEQHRAERQELRVSRVPAPAHGSDEELLAAFLARTL